MPWPDDDIPELVKGERPTLLEAETDNEVVTAINALRNITITPGQVDEVNYATDEVAIVYSGSEGGIAGSVKVIDAEDVTKQLVITWDSSGVLESITSETSFIEEKEIVICEDGSEETYTFLVKTS